MDRLPSREGWDSDQLSFLASVNEALILVVAKRHPGIWISIDEARRLLPIEVQEADIIAALSLFGDNSPIHSQSFGDQLLLSSVV